MRIRPSIEISREKKGVISGSSLSAVMSELTDRSDEYTDIHSNGRKDVQINLLVIETEMLYYIY